MRAKRLAMVPPVFLHSDKPAEATSSRRASDEHLSKRRLAGRPTVRLAKRDGADENGDAKCHGLLRDADRLL
jgi:hypothetical protein